MERLVRWTTWVIALALCGLVVFAIVNWKWEPNEAGQRVYRLFEQIEPGMSEAAVTQLLDSPDYKDLRAVRHSQGLTVLTSPPSLGSENPHLIVNLEAGKVIIVQIGSSEKGVTETKSKRPARHP